MLCPHANECSGCSLWATDYPKQVEEKTLRLQSLAGGLGYAGQILCHSLGPIKIRDRADLQWRADEGWGFLSKDFKTIKVIDHCPLFTEPLQALFQWWSKFSLKAPKASVRLRVDPQGCWGVWLDMANIEIKDLLQEDALLTEWTSRAHIEIGQRYKVLQKVQGQWKLVDPQLRCWFTSTSSTNKEIHLYGSIGSFTQAGVAINHELVRATLGRAVEQPLRSVVELGAGSGNFTLSLASEGFSVKALEQSASALAGLERSLQEYPELSKRIELITGNFQTLNWGEWSEQESLLLLDPPRSGVGENLLKQIPQGKFPVVIYVACGVEAWEKDGKTLTNLGYRLTSLEWVDQFPNTPLFEVISVWEKSYT